MRIRKVARDLARNFVMGPVVMAGLFVLMSVEYTVMAARSVREYCRG